MPFVFPSSLDSLNCRPVMNQTGASSDSSTDGEALQLSGLRTGVPLSAPLQIPSQILFLGSNSSSSSSKTNRLKL